MLPVLLSVFLARFLYNHIDTDQEQWLAAGMDLTSGNFSGRVQKGEDMTIYVQPHRLQHIVTSMPKGSTLVLQFDSRRMSTAAFVRFAFSLRDLGVRFDAVAGDRQDEAQKKKKPVPHWLKVVKVT